MHRPTVAPEPTTGRAATLARRGGARPLAAALADSRRATLATFADYRAALGDALAVPLDATLNPPLWELGHIGWFQEYWLARNPQWRRGASADPGVERLPPLRSGADALYNSSRVPHDSRWSLPLPDADATVRDLAAQLERTLQRLHEIDGDGDDLTLYFFRLSLMHEDMHHEAALYMARTLDLAVSDPRAQQPPERLPAGELAFDAGVRVQGSDGSGFAFDNECRGHEVAVDAFAIDRRAVTWREYLPFVEAGGYGDARWWSADGARWRAACGAACPRYLRRDGSAWLVREQRCWRALDLDRAACHLSWFEADAWCRWAGRRLPTEGEWERAATQRPAEFDWGRVWEWTCSPFAPYPGFEPHPYRDYSAPWFDGRPVLRGASHLTQDRMRHPAYRNYFTPERTDIAAGFRSCAA